MKILNKWAVLSLCVWPLWWSEALAVQVPPPVELVFEDRSLTVDFNRSPQLLRRVSEHVLSLGDFSVPLELAESLPEASDWMKVNTRFKHVIAPKELEAFIARNVSLLDPAQSAVKINMSETGFISIEGFPKSGFEVDFATLAPLLNEALANGQRYVRVPSDKTFSRVEVPDELRARGIQDVVSIGQSNFAGSSDARRQNIAVAARKYNGMIIESGEQFSFNQTLGSVDPADGFVEELVIKGDDTEKEFGGGVCQVSTTVYRAAFEGGLSIDQRRNHSYAVPYYTPQGMDATIYLGGQDFKFTNDTPGDLLMQTHIYGDNLYFVFYGTDDGRQVTKSGPFYSNYRPVPEPVIIDTTILPPGEEALLSAAHDGFDVAWVREVYYPDKDEKERLTFSSNYRAWPAKILRGALDFSLENSTFAPTTITQ